MLCSPCACSPKYRAKMQLTPWRVKQPSTILATCPLAAAPTASQAYNNDVVVAMQAEVGISAAYWVTGQVFLMCASCICMAACQNQSLHVKRTQVNNDAAHRESLTRVMSMLLLHHLPALSICTSDAMPCSCTWCARPKGT